MGLGQLVERALLMFPTPFTVQRVRRTRSGENALGQPTYTETVKNVAVCSIQPTNQSEQYTAALAGRTVTDLKITCPTNDFQANDAVVVDGVTYEVDGQIADYTHGWHGWKPGYTIRLRRVTDA